MIFKITGIQIFDYSENRQVSEYDFEPIYSWSANITINEDFLIQAASNGNISIPTSCETFWNDAARQDWAIKAITTGKITLADIIEQTGLRADRDWLVENGGEIMNPEDAPPKK